MKFQVKVEYGREKFVKFYVEADVVDGKVLRYSFSSLVEDIRRTCGSLRHRKVFLRVSKPDSPVVQTTVQAKRGKFEQEMSTPARETEHMQKLDPRSLESSFANAANPE